MPGGFGGGFGGKPPASGGMGDIPSVMKPMGAVKPMQPMRPPFFERSEMKGMTGGLNSSVAGRTDHIATRVPQGSYVMPADVVSGLGQGNSLAGMKVLGHMFGGSPYGVGSSSGGSGGGLSPAHLSFPKMFAGGGGVAGDQTGVPIMAAGGEYVIPPEHVAAIGGGDMAAGHDILDRFVERTRQKTIDTMRALPGPVQ